MTEPVKQIVSEADPLSAEDLLNRLQNELGHALSCQAWLYHLYGEKEHFDKLQTMMPELWGAFQSGLHADLFSTIGRLTDPPRMGKNENISIGRLLEREEVTVETRVLGEKLIADLKNEQREIQAVRNKAIAHKDYEVVVSGEAPKFKPISIDKILFTIADLLDAAGKDIDPHVPPVTWSFFVEKRIELLMTYIDHAVAGFGKSD